MSASVANVLSNKRRPLFNVFRNCCSSSFITSFICST